MAGSKICPQCGKILSSTATICRACGCRISQRVNSEISRSDALAPLMQLLGRFVKLIFIIAIVGLIGWGVVLGGKKFIKSTVVENVHPTDPAETTSEFFYFLQDVDQVKCYRLLVAGRKAATVIGKQNKHAYFSHFDRMRIYLQERVGKNFTEKMEVSENGRKVVFNQTVVLNVQLESSPGSDEKKHYGIGEFTEFPIDVAPAIGLEKHYRGLDNAIGGLNPDDDLDDPSEIVRPRQYESKSERQARMISSFKQARMLDTQHIVLEWLIREFGQQKTTQSFLKKLANDQAQPLQLRELARQYI